jgi:hypothetical protein
MSLPGCMVTPDMRYACVCNSHEYGCIFVVRVLLIEIRFRFFKLGSMFLEIMLYVVSVQHFTCEFDLYHIMF